MTHPLILTLWIDPAAMQFFHELRRQHFPKERNFIQAHLTLFHALENKATILEQVYHQSNNQNQFTLQVAKPVSIGNGTAFKIESPELQTLHQKLQQLWWPELIPQDRQKLWPHITIQNKVPAFAARELLAELTKNFTPFTLQALGLQIWEYIGGPWQFVQQYPFVP